jgi:glycosyltransferase involved in cell wall biosynthesis
MAYDLTNKNLIAVSNNLSVILTIAIPTYNRHTQLKNTLANLIPQLTNKCFLIVIDNASDIPIEVTTLDLFADLDETNYKLFRNKSNIGADSNIMRCFEYCETDWLWTLGDDDDISSDAIQTILADIKRYNDAINIHYYSPNKLHPCRNDIKIQNGRIEYLNSIDSFAGSIFMSTNIYNCSKLTSRAVTKANMNTYSCCAHWLLLFNSLNSTSITIQSNKIICLNNVEFEGFSSFALTIVRGLSTLFDLDLTEVERKIIRKKLIWVSKNWLRLESILIILLVLHQRSYKDLNYNFFRIYNIFYKYCGTINKMKYLFWKICVKVSPGLTFALIRQLYLAYKKIDIKSFIKS